MAMATTTAHHRHHHHRHHPLPSTVWFSSSTSVAVDALPGAEIAWLKLRFARFSDACSIHWFAPECY
eukprot:6946916-Lingulodinium_polyedra.AAC.1